VLEKEPDLRLFLKEPLFQKKHDGNGKSAGKNDFPGGFLV
jgi:hypothetical protein